MVTYSSPESAPASRRGRRGLVVAIGCVALLAIGFGVYLWTRSGSTSHQPAAAGPAPAAATPAPAPVPPVRHRAIKARKRTPHQRVAPAVPTAFTLTGRRFTIKAHVCSMAPVFPLDPPGEQHHTVCWVNGGFGVAPSSSAATSYVLGHAWAEDSQEVLNKLSAPATRQVLRAKPHLVDGVKVYPVHDVTGYRLVLRTPAGRLTYRVSKAYGVGKLDLGQVKSALNQHVRNRVVLITCAERRGVDYDYNIVLYAKLYSSVRAAPSRA